MNEDLHDVGHGRYASSKRFISISFHGRRIPRNTTHRIDISAIPVNRSSKVRLPPGGFEPGPRLDYHRGTGRRRFERASTIDSHILRRLAMRWLHSTAVASAILATTILTTAVAAGRAAESKTYVKRTEHEFRLGNAAVELGFVLTDTHCGLDWLDNRLAGRRLPDFDDNFSIGIEGRKPLTARRLHLSERRRRSPPRRTAARPSLRRPNARHRTGRDLRIGRRRLLRPAAA